MLRLEIIKWLKVILIGFFSGFLSGHFGIGGGLITTPAIRLLLEKSAWIAVGTPLLVMIPSALTGAFNYYRKELVEKNILFTLIISGLIGVILGSLATTQVSGHFLMLITALIILLIGLRFLFPIRILRDRRPQTIDRRLFLHRNFLLAPILIGSGAGFFSGFLGLGGGFLLVPAFIFFLEFDLKKAFGTSLVTISAFAFPGSILHYYLHHVDLQLAFLLTLGVMPGSYLGSKVAISLPDKLLRILFGLFLIFVSLYFTYFEASFLKG